MSDVGSTRPWKGPSDRSTWRERATLRRARAGRPEAGRKLLIGRGVTHGMGAGGRPEIGERCAEISEQELRNQIGDADLTFITVGLGGGTGTGVAPHVAELAQAAGSVVISLATTPFRAERGRMTNARAGIQRLRDRTDSLI